MKAIILQGKTNSGKTHIITSLRDKLINDANAQVLHPKDGVFGYDFQAVLKINNKLVSLNSCGDDNDCISKTISDFEGTPIDIVVFVVNNTHIIYGSKWLAWHGMTMKEIIDVVEVLKDNGQFVCKVNDNNVWRYSTLQAQIVERLYNDVMNNI